MLENKETWWWYEKVQGIVANKKKQFKVGQQSTRREYWKDYYNLCKKAKSEVSKAKLKR